MVIDVKESVWQEKYRPKNVNDVITIYKEQILNAMKNPLSIQNYIFYSRTGGTGKTSLAKAIINDLECDYLTLNASDERSIDTIRTKVKDFMMSVGVNKQAKKCIMMDEGEKLTKDSADALKNMMEEYSSNCFIILTTNNITKIPQPLQTRFKILEFSQPKKEDIKIYLEQICRNEKLSFNQEGLNKIISIHYPSIRKMVNHLQDLKNQNASVHQDIVSREDELHNNLWSLIQQQKYEEVKNLIISKGIDTEELNKNIFYYLMKQNVSKTEIQIIPILARNERDFKLGADPHIIFIASVIDMIKIFRANNG